MFDPATEQRCHRTGPLIWRLPRAAEPSSGSTSHRCLGGESERVVVRCSTLPVFDWASGTQARTPRCSIPVEAVSPPWIPFAPEYGHARGPAQPALLCGRSSARPGQRAAPACALRGVRSGRGSRGAVRRARARCTRARARARVGLGWVAAAADGCGYGSRSAAVAAAAWWSAWPSWRPSPAGHCTGGFPDAGAAARPSSRGAGAGSAGVPG